MIAESSANDPRLVRPPALGGIGCDAVWNDDVHHALRVALTGDRRGYYVDYDGVDDLAVALARRWVFSGRRSIYRGRRHGRPADDVAPEHFVVFTVQPRSRRQHARRRPPAVRPPQRLVAAATVLLSPFTPLLFMGEEYGEMAPFPFFVDHGDPELLEATRRGRREEFARRRVERRGRRPGRPGDVRRRRPRPVGRRSGPHAAVLAAYTELLALRRRHERDPRPRRRAARRRQRRRHRRQPSARR